MIKWFLIYFLKENMNISELHVFNTKEIFNKIKEVEVFFISEIIVREKIRKTLKKYITALTFVDKNLLLLWVQVAVWIFCSKCISV